MMKTKKFNEFLNEAVEPDYFLLTKGGMFVEAFYNVMKKYPKTFSEFESVCQKWNQKPWEMISSIMEMQDIKFPKEVTKGNLINYFANEIISNNEHWIIQIGASHYCNEVFDWGEHDVEFYENLFNGVMDGKLYLKIMGFELLTKKEYVIDSLDSLKYNLRDIKNELDSKDIEWSPDDED